MASWMKSIKDQRENTYDQIQQQSRVRRYCLPYVCAEIESSQKIKQLISTKERCLNGFFFRGCANTRIFFPPGRTYTVLIQWMIHRSHGFREDTLVPRVPDTERVGGCVGPADWRTLVREHWVCEFTMSRTCTRPTYGSRPHPPTHPANIHFHAPHPPTSTFPPCTLTSALTEIHCHPRLHPLSPTSRVYSHFVPT